MTHPKGKYRAFTPAEDRLIITLHELSHICWATIGSRLGRKPGVCANRYRLLTANASQAPIKSVAEIEAQSFKNISALIAARDERDAARTQRDEQEVRGGSITSAFFGDPPPGYSALDRKRATGRHV